MARSRWGMVALVVVFAVGALASWRWLSSTPSNAPVAAPSGASPERAAPVVVETEVESVRSSVEVQDALVPQVETALEVRVRWKGGGGPAAGVEVGVLSLPVRDGAEAANVAGVTDEEGSARLIVPPRERLVLTVTDPLGGAQTKQNVPPVGEGSTATVEALVERLAIGDALVFHGIALDAAGRPVSGARVHVGAYQGLHWSTPDPPAGRTAAATADDAGRFELRAPLADDTAVRVDAPGHAPAFEWLDGGCPTPESPCVMTLQLQASIVADLGPLLPDERERVLVTCRSSVPTLVREDADNRFGFYLAMKDLTWRGTPGADGLARIDGLPPGQDLRVSVSGLAERGWVEHPELQLQPGEVRLLRFAPGSGATVTGTLHDAEGAPLDGAELALKPGELEPWDFPVDGERQGVRPVTTDGGGRFRFDDVSDGTWHVGPTRASGIVLIAESFAVVGGRQDRALELVGVRGETIEGRVLTRDGEPLAEVEVMAKAVDAWRMERAETDASGAFRVGPLAPGEYFLTVLADDSAPRFDEGGSTRVATGARDVVLHPQENGALRVRLVDAANGTSLGGFVLISSLDERRMPSGGKVETVDEDDELVIEGLAPGPWSLTAWTPEGAIAVHANALVDSRIERSITLRAQPGTYVKIEGVGENDFVWAVRDGMVVGIANLDGTDAGESNSRRMLLPPGPVTLLVLDAAHPEAPPVERSYEVPPGGELQIVDVSDGL